VAIDSLLDGTHCGHQLAGARAARALAIMIPTSTGWHRTRIATGSSCSTKALAQDQSGGLRALACPRLMPATAIDTFDGDTRRNRGPACGSVEASYSRIGHAASRLLPNHSLWSRYFTALLRGAGRGARLSRHPRFALCEHSATTPPLIACTTVQRPSSSAVSATIANARKHAGRLCGVDFERWREWMVSRFESISHCGTGPWWTRSGVRGWSPTARPVPSSAKWSPGASAVWYSLVSADWRSCSMSTRGAAAARRTLGSADQPVCERDTSCGPP
jgi:hypothetical protein